MCKVAATFRLPLVVDVVMFKIEVDELKFVELKFIAFVSKVCAGVRPDPLKTSSNCLGILPPDVLSNLEPKCLQ